MAKYKVTMICREIWRATAFVEAPIGKDLEDLKDEAWAEFDINKSMDLEQENFTKVEVVDEEQ